MPLVHASASSGGEPNWTSSLLGEVEGINLHPESSDGGIVDDIGVDHELAELALGIGSGKLDEQLASISKVDLVNDGVRDDFPGPILGFRFLGQ